MAETNTGNQNTGDRNTGYGNTGHRNTGDGNKGRRNTGDLNTGHRNTGHSNTGHRNTGDRNTGHRNTGHRNTGDRNTGHRNTGHRNTGDRNTGHSNTGNRNTGDRNTGDRNAGNRNTGYRNTGDYSAGYLCTQDCLGLSLFNKPITKEELKKQTFPKWLYFDLTERINENEMTEQEKIDNPTYKTTGGYLKKYEYQEAFKNSYNRAKRKEQLKIKDLLHFDADIFYEISGIKVDDEPVKGKKVKVVLDGVEYDATID